MLQTREQEITASLQVIKKTFSFKKFEHKLVADIKNYLKNSENISYYDMRNQLNWDFNTDMTPIFMYIINTVSIMNPDLTPYIKVIDKIKFQYGTVLHRIHETAINPVAPEKLSGMEHLKPDQGGQADYNSKVIPLPPGGKKENPDNSAGRRAEILSYRGEKFINDTVKTM